MFELSHNKNPARSNPDSLQGKLAGSTFGAAQVVWSIDFVLVKTHHSPYFVEKTLPKTILNCFHPRSPAGGFVVAQDNVDRSEKAVSYEVAIP